MSYHFQPLALFFMYIEMRTKTRHINTIGNVVNRCSDISLLDQIILALQNATSHLQREALLDLPFTPHSPGLIPLPPPGSKSDDCGILHSC